MSIEVNEKDKREIVTELSESVTDLDLENNTDKTISVHEDTLEKEEPDGGYGWLVVLGAFCVQVTSFGVVSSVMQDYFQQNLFYDNEQALLDLSFVGTLALVFINGSAPFVQIGVSRFGLLPVMIFGSFCIVVSLEMAGFAYEVWHLYLSQGVLFGLGASCMYVAVMAVTPQWFTKNRGLALGIVAGGSGMGGLILPFIITPINAKLGSGWSYRVVGFICLFCNIIACIFVKERNHRVKTKKKLSEVFQLDVLKNVNFLIFGIGSDIAIFGYFIPFFFVPANASSLGMSDSQGSAFISVMSATNFVGRLLAGVIADKFGNLNSNLLFHLIAALSNLLIWTFAKTYGTFMAFSAVFGLASGSYFALMSPISAKILGMEKFPTGLSFLFVANALPIFGTNISSAIQTHITSDPFIVYKMFSGVAFLLGFFILLILRFRLDRRIFAKV